MERGLGAWRNCAVRCIRGVLYLLWPLLAQRSGTPEAGAPLAAVLRSLALQGTPWMAFMVYYAAVNPVLEEVYWRVLLGSPARGLTLSDVCFGGYHVTVLGLLLPGSPGLRWPLGAAMGATLVGAGWLWRQIVARTGGMAIPVLTHLVTDLSIILAGNFLAFG